MAGIQAGDKVGGCEHAGGVRAVRSVRGQRVTAEFPVPWRLGTEAWPERPRLFHESTGGAPKCEGGKWSEWDFTEKQKRQFT